MNDKYNDIQNEILRLEDQYERIQKERMDALDKADKYNAKADSHYKKAHQRGHSIWTWAWRSDLEKYNREKASKYGTKALDLEEEGKEIQSQIGSLKATKTQIQEQRQQKIDMTKERYVDPIQQRYKEKYQIRQENMQRFQGERIDPRNPGATATAQGIQMDPKQLNNNRVMQADSEVTSRWKQNEQAELENQTSWQKVKETRNEKKSNQDPELQEDKNNAFTEAKEDWQKDSDNYVLERSGKRDLDRDADRTQSRDR